MMQWMIDEPDQHLLPDVPLADLYFDINSKLTAILVSTQYLESIKNLPHPVPKLLDIIHGDAQSIYGMLSKLNSVIKKDNPAL